MSTSSSTPTGSRGSGTFLLFVYNWNHSHDSEKDSLETFSTLTEAEQAYSGRQDAAEVAIVRDGYLQVISRANRKRSTQQVQWLRETEWSAESPNHASL
jgi:hypothetical protein